MAEVNGLNNGSASENGSGESWDSFSLRMNKSLAASKLSVRRPFLEQDLLQRCRQGLDKIEAQQVFKALLPTSLRYTDNVTTKAVLAVVDAILAPRRERGAEPQLAMIASISTWIEAESSKALKAGTVAGGTKLALLSWATALLRACRTGEKFAALPEPARVALVQTLATLAYELLDPAATPKHSMRSSALTIARRALRDVPTAIPHIVPALINARDPQPSYKNAVIVGTAVDVTLRLKCAAEPRRIAQDYILGSGRAEILQYYLDKVLGARGSTPPPHVTHAFDDFFRSVVPASEAEPVVAQMEKILLRSPEAAFPVAAAFVEAANESIVQLPAVREKLLAQAVSSSKSTNPNTRAGAVALAAAYVKRGGDASGVAADVAAVLRGGKTVSADHRATLCQVLAAVPAAAGHSPDVVAALMALLAKESNEGATLAALEATRCHLPAALAAGGKVDTAALGKCLQDTKVAIRRRAFDVAGEVAWDMGAEQDSSHQFADALAPQLEAALKNVSANPVNAPAGPLEAYVAVALLLGKAASWQGKAQEVASSNAVLSSLLTLGAKSSFMLWDRVYRKVSALEEERWLARAVEALMLHPSNVSKWSADVSLGSAALQPLLRIVTDTSHPAASTAVNEVISKLTALHPIATHAAMQHALRARLEQPTTTIKTDEGETAVDRSPRLLTLTPALASFDESFTGPDRDQVLASWLILLHHPRLGRPEESSWIEMLRHARVRPEDLIQARLTSMLGLIWEATSPESADKSLASAAYRAASILCLVEPSSVVTALFAQAVDDLEPARLDFIGPTEMGIFRTAEGTLYTDVLAASKSKQQQPTVEKGKDRDIQLWEAEIRKNLAAKKPQTGALSKEERKLVEAELAKESETRRAVQSAIGHLARGFALVRCLAHSQVEQVREYFAPLIDSMISVVCVPSIVLAGSLAFETLMDMNTLCSDRLGTAKSSLAVAILRALESPIVPEDYCAEHLGDLISRVLYRLRFVSEADTLDSQTYSFAQPLASHVIACGGVRTSDEETENDTALEQVTLAVDVISFHVSLCADISFPRLRMLRDLLTVLSIYPSLVRSATAALADLGRAMGDNARSTEIVALLSGSMTDQTDVRFACVQTLNHMDLTEMDFPEQLWILVHDDDERTRELASDVWDENGLDVPTTFLPRLLPYLDHASQAVRSGASKAIAEAVIVHGDQVDATLQTIADAYVAKAKELLPEYDRFGMLVEASLNAQDPWRTRVAQAQALRLMASAFTSAHVFKCFELFIQQEALGDRSEEVRSAMIEAASEIIELHGQECLQELITTFETFLGKPTAKDVQTGDYITEALIILYGRLAQHFESGDPKVREVLGRLVDALRTPSEVVQAAVCDCMQPLIRTAPDEVPQLVDQLSTWLFKSSKYAERRGAAYGLAGIIKGRGIFAIKEFYLVALLRDNAEDKKSTSARQGAMFAIEIFASVLGRLFEPYIPEVLTTLLSGLSDSSTDVRDAAGDASKAVMSKLSGHGLKLILPTLLETLDDKQWRTKRGAIEIIGSMAYLAPQQLAKSLPTIIPRLTEVLTDTHKQVRESANSSLKRFGEVVTNPEIKGMQKVLLDALVDPTKKIARALDKLLTTTFAHFVDGSSLALVVPILDRALRERSAEMKRKSTAIVGNLATITERRDLVPYLNQLVPLVRTVLVDPVPEARTTAAKTLGSLVERLGEQNFPDLMDALLNVLKSPSSGVDQQGAAQGIAEILSSLGVERLDEMLPTILANTSSPRAYVREGHISLLVFLPSTFGDRFSPYLARIIHPVLKGLADDSDFVRDASMRAGRMIVANHSSKAVELLLPELEEGLFHQSWRIRLSSVQLVGDLLFRLTGISGKADEGDEDVNDEDEDTAPVNTSVSKALLEALGPERRDRILSGLYVIRQDTSGMVRTASIHVWKALVPNTPRMVRDMLPTLMQLVVRILANPGYEQRETAARCLAETCRKLGESAFGEVVRILAQTMSTGERRQREGVCLAVAGMLHNTNVSYVEAHEGAIIEIVRSGLIDTDSGVRVASARAFDVAQEVLGPHVLDRTIPVLLEALDSGDERSEAALSALKEVMSVRSEKIFPVLIPRLIAPPITSLNARALASLVKVAGSALGRRITSIVDALFASRSQGDEETRTEVDAALSAVLAAVVDHGTGLATLQMHLLGLSKADDSAKRVEGCNLLARFCQANKAADATDYNVDWVRQLVSLFDDRVADVVVAAWEAMDALVKKIDKEDMEPLVVPLRRTIESTGSPGRPVEGFSRPNGLKPILPVILQGLLAGTAEQREQAAYAIGDLVERTAPEAFKSYCIQTVGPLIRVMGDRFPPPVKTAILSTLAVTLQRVPQFARPFFPQLQRTFVKSLTDPTSLSVRSRAAHALGVLMVHQTRVDPVVTELVNLASNEEGEVRDSVAGALANVIVSGGKNMSETSKSAVVDLVSEAFAEHNKETFNVAIARVVAALAQSDISTIDTLLDLQVFGELPPTQLTSLALRELLENRDAAKTLYDTLEPLRVVERALQNSGADQPPAIARPGRESKELLRTVEPWASDSEVKAKLN